MQLHTEYQVRHHLALYRVSSTSDDIRNDVDLIYGDKHSILHRHQREPLFLVLGVCDTSVNNIIGIAYIFHGRRISSSDIAGYSSLVVVVVK